MFAQALAEYGLIAAMVTAVESAWATVTDLFITPDSRLVYLVGFAALGWMSIRLLRR